MPPALSLRIRQRNLLAKLQAIGGPCILPTDHKTQQSARGLHARGYITLEPLDLPSADGGPVYVASVVENASQ